MSKGFSSYLNFLRVLAAFVVVLSHFAYERFSRGDYLFIREWNLGSDAVILFFVLSGFVIAYTAREKDKTLGQFTFARATRLYSVVIPAVCATIVFDTLGHAINPAAYDGWWWNSQPVGEMLLRSLSFSTEWGLSGFRVGTNGPFWSLSYEAAYYILFAIAIFSGGLRRALLVTIAILVIGPKALFLMPAWLFGVWLYHRSPSIRLTRNMAYTCFVTPVLVYALALGFHVPAILLKLTNAMIGETAVGLLRFSNEFIWNGLLGAMVTIHLAGALSLFRERSQNGQFVKWVTWLSGASFSVYLVHYPAMQFFQAILPTKLAASWHDLLLLGLTISVCLLFASIYERPLGQFRELARRCLSAPGKMRMSIQSLRQ